MLIWQVGCSIQAALQRKGLVVGGINAAAAASRLLLVLTDGALRDSSVLAHLKRALSSSSLARQLSSAARHDVALEVVQHDWTFGSDEQCAVCSSDDSIACVAHPSLAMLSGWLLMDPRAFVRDMTMSYIVGGCFNTKSSSRTGRPTKQSTSTKRWWRRLCGASVREAQLYRSVASLRRCTGLHK